MLIDYQYDIIMHSTDNLRQTEILDLILEGIESKLRN